MDSSQHDRELLEVLVSPVVSAIWPQVQPLHQRGQRPHCQRRRPQQGAGYRASAKGALPDPLGGQLGCGGMGSAPAEVGCTQCNPEQMRGRALTELPGAAGRLESL